MIINRAPPPAPSARFAPRTWASSRLQARASGLADGAAVVIEEFIEGHEGLLRYADRRRSRHTRLHQPLLPNVLEAMRERWISPQIIATNRMNAPAHEEIKEMGRQ